MAFKKKTLRTMSPTARKVARLAGEIDSVARRFKNMIPELQRLDLDSKALETAKQVSNPIRDQRIGQLVAVKRMLGIIQAYDWEEIPKYELVEILEQRVSELETVK